MMWIKICGLTSADAVSAALDARVNAIGFVFTESIRRLTAAAATHLAAPARGRTLCVAVMRHPTQAAIDEILAEFRPDVLQSDAADLPGLRLPGQLDLLPVLRSSECDTRELPRRLLFEGPVSGAGVPCDWVSARLMARRSQLILAGGLNAANVAAAISDVQPFGVDVSSGVEERPGIKSPAQIARFVAAAHDAGAEGQQRINHDIHRT